MPPDPPIYLDAHATTPCAPEVVDAMAPLWREQFGNAASRQHRFGWQAEALVERARESVADLIGAGPTEIVFTSGATESDNLAVKGVARAYAARGRHLIVAATEHKAVLDPCARLEAEGFEVSYLSPDADGRIRAGDVEAAITPQTVLVSIMFANNETGVVNPIAEIGELCKRRGVVFHCDAVQALPWLDCNVRELGIALLSISAHKMYGPKGVGALYVRRRDPRVRLMPIIDGGGHERGLRSGTLNVPGIVGLGRACELTAERREQNAARVAALRDRLLEKLRAELPDLIVNGTLEHRLPNNLHASFPSANADALMTEMKDVAVSSGSACTTATMQPSHVLRAMGVAEELAECSLRFGLSRYTTEREIDRAAAKVVEAVRKLRAESPSGIA